MVENAVVFGYTDFGKVSSITEGDYSYSIDYSPDGARAKSYLTDGNGGYTARFYGNGTEKAVGDNYNLDYLSYLCHGAIVVHHGTGRHAPPPTPTAVLQGYYDAQGSLIALVNASGNVVQRFAYDPWGRRVDPDDWTQDDTQTDLYHINRGYTMHEHLREFGLINMNGRVFDPAVAQFLSPDNYIQADGNWLNYNRYAYCLNNPLKYTDPSGDLFSEIVVAKLVFSAVSGLCQGVVNLCSMYNEGYVHDLTDGLIAFGIGAASGFISSMAASFIPGGGFVGGLTNGATSGFISTFGTQLGNHYLLGTESMNPKQILTATLSGAIVGGLCAGVQSLLEGYNFWDGGPKLSGTPPHEGFAGTPEHVDIPEVTRLDRYGGTSPKSDYLALEGTAPSQRSLPSTVDLNIKDSYVVSPGHSVPALYGRTAPWYGQPGGGVQYKLDNPINFYVNQGSLIRITIQF